LLCLCRDDHWQNCTTVCPNGTIVSSYATVTRSNGQIDHDYQGCVNATGGKVAGSRQIPWYSDGSDPGMGPYGTPQFDLHRFPDVKAMVAKGHGLGLRPGWYMGNYQCSGANNQVSKLGLRQPFTAACIPTGMHGPSCNFWANLTRFSLQCVHGGSRGTNCTAWDMDKLAAGSVDALVRYGFDSVKLDSGFSSHRR
jgi:hypothetical protein